MNGTITLKSKDGDGAVFTVSLPDIEISSIAADYLELEKDTLLPEIEFEKAKILYVEDILSNRQVVKAYLESYNLIIVEVENGEEALSILQKTTFDLILMDMEMPIMDGFEASKIIRSNPKYQSIPILAITASVMNADKKRVLKYCDEYLKKPVSKKELVSNIAKYLPHIVIQESDKRKAIVQEKEKSVELKLQEFDREISESIKKDFRNTFNPLYEEIKETYSTDETEEFARRSIEFGEKHNIEFMTDFGNQLLSASESFKLDKIEELVDLYPEILKVLGL